MIHDDRPAGQKGSPFDVGSSSGRRACPLAVLSPFLVQISFALLLSDFHLPRRIAPSRFVPSFFAHNRLSPLPSLH